MSSLPKIDLPLFEIEVPSTKKKIKYRPFTVKEEKILLIAQESKDMDQISLAIKQIINNCVTGVNVDDLATFDLEYILINIRAKSVSNEITFKIKDPETKETVELNLDISEIKLTNNPEHTKIIRLNEDMNMMMRYPSINELSIIFKNGPRDTTSIFNVMLSCIDSIVDNDVIYKIKDFTDAEVANFVNDLSSQHVSSIKTFFETMPILRYEKKYINKNGNEKTFVIEGLESFFI